MRIWTLGLFVFREYYNSSFSGNDDRGKLTEQALEDLQVETKTQHCLDGGRRHHGLLTGLVVKNYLMPQKGGA